MGRSGGTVGVYPSQRARDPAERQVAGVVKQRPYLANVGASLDGDR